MNDTDIINDKNKKSKNKPSPKKNYTKAIIMAVFSIVVVLASFYILSCAFQNAVESAKNAYETSKEDKAEEVYASYYQKGYESAEKKYHVKNEISIEIGNIKEISRLEVLSVNDVEYSIRNEEESDSQSNIWLKSTGKGVYTIDLSMSEIITDTKRNYVLIRVPRPALTDVTLTKLEPRLYENKTFRNYSLSAGEKEAKEMELECFEKTKSYLKTNINFYQSAEKAAVSILSSLIKGFNPNNDNLTVDVEFYI